MSVVLQIFWLNLSFLNIYIWKFWISLFLSQDIQLVYKGWTWVGKRRTSDLFFSRFLNSYLFTWLHWALVAAPRTISCSMWTLSCGTWDLVPWPGINPGTPAVGTQSLSPWEVPGYWICGAEKWITQIVKYEIIS